MLLGILLSQVAMAADVYTINVYVYEPGSESQVQRVEDDNGIRYLGADLSRSSQASNAQQIIDFITDFDEREESVDGESEKIFGVINFRGVPIELNFSEFGEPGLEFSIPDLNERKTDFAGNSRQAQLNDFKDYLESNAADLVSRLYRLLAKKSPSDPIAGNPGSAQSAAAERDYERGFTHKVSQVWGCGTSARNEQIMLAKAGFACQQEVAAAGMAKPWIEVAQMEGTMSDMPSDSLYDDYFDRMKRVRGENKASIGLQYAQISATGGGNKLKTTMISLPLAYTVVFDSDPRKKLVFSFPISMSDTEGAVAYQAALSVGFSYPVNDRWALTPSAGLSIVGSEDLAAASALSSYSLTSSYTFQLGEWALNVGNMLGVYSTEKLKIGEYESDPDISNTVFTNGVLVSGPSTLLADDLVMEYFVNDTRYSGDDLFTDSAQEIGVNFGKLNTVGEVVSSYLKGGISYMKASGDGGNKADALRLSLVYKF